MLYISGDVSSVDISLECIYFAVRVQGADGRGKCEVGLQLHNINSNIRLNGPQTATFAFVAG